MNNRRKIRQLRNIELEPGAKFNFRPCMDAIRCIVSFDGKGFSIVAANEIENYIAKIIFVLESPHIDEFDTRGRPIAPAQGDTGDNFDANILDVLLLTQHYHSPYERGAYEVWLVNAVQYQASLGVATKVYRSIVFQAAWHCFAKSEFIKRIEKLVNNNQKTIVYNACTRGNTIVKNKAKKLLQSLPVEKELSSLIEIDKNSIDLKRLVGKAIKEAVPFLRVIPATHPYQWCKFLSQQKGEPER